MNIRSTTTEKLQNILLYSNNKQIVEEVKEELKYRQEKAKLKRTLRKAKPNLTLRADNCAKSLVSSHYACHGCDIQFVCNYSILWNKKWN